MHHSTIRVEGTSPPSSKMRDFAAVSNDQIQNLFQTSMSALDEGISRENIKLKREKLQKFENFRQKIAGLIKNDQNTPFLSKDVFRHNLLFSESS